MYNNNNKLLQFFFFCFVAIYSYFLSQQNKKNLKKMRNIEWFE